MPISSWRGDHDSQVQRVCGTYLEQPTLSLSSAQARRLFSLDDEAWGAVRDVLVRARFLFQTGDGRFVRFNRS